MIDKKYAELLKEILDNGTELETRNSIVKRSTNLMLKCEGTPLIYVRKTAWKNALREMEWFLSGSSNINDLHEKVRHWWKPWADKEGIILNNYSQQFRESKSFDENFDHDTVDLGDAGAMPEYTDQIKYMIETLKNHPNSRRNVITTWNTGDMTHPETPITNCHGTVIQAFVNEGIVDLTMYQRSADMVLGVPHNLIQYHAFIMYLAHQSGLKPGNLTVIFGDAHIYEDHYNVAGIIEKTAINNNYHLTKPYELVYTPSSDDFKADDFSLNQDYESLINFKLNMVI